MSSDFWDGVFGAKEYAYGTNPNAFLVEQKPRLPTQGDALAIADGEGRNGVWLAEQGLRVTSVDYSAAGLAKAKKLAAERKVEIDTILADLSHWAWPENKYDVAVSVFAHFPPDIRKNIHVNLARSLKPGGLLLLQAYTPRQLQYGTGGPPVEAMLYTESMLRADFAGLDFLVLREHDSHISEGTKHQGMSALIDLVAKKPS